MAKQMAAMMAQAEPGSTPMLTAPMTCPLFPGFAGGTSAPSHALAASAASLPFLLTQAHSPALGHAAARMRPIRTRAARGPPEQIFRFDPERRIPLKFAAYILDGGGLSPFPG